MEDVVSILFPCYKVRCYMLHVNIHVNIVDRCPFESRGKYKSGDSGDDGEGARCQCQCHSYHIRISLPLVAFRRPSLETPPPPPPGP